MTEPKGEKPDSDHPHEDDLSLDLSHDQEGLPAGGEEHPPHDPSLSASTDEFHFSGPVEELDFSEPTDFAFPTGQAAEAESVSEQSGSFVAEPAGAEQSFGAEGGFGAEETPAESPLPEEAGVQSELAGEGIADLALGEESAEEKPKPKFELPAWVRIAEWVMVGVFAVGALLALIITSIWVEKNPKQVTLTLNIACPLLLGLIAYALWRSMPRWVTPAASALYTVMLALSAAALVAATWFMGTEVSRYDWQFSKTRVAAGKPPPVIMADLPQPAEPKAAEPAAAPAEPAAPKPSDSAAPAK